MNKSRKCSEIEKNKIGTDKYVDLLLKMCTFYALFLDFD